MSWADRYTEPGWMRREHDRLWPRVWLYAGPALDVAEPGGWFVFELGLESILVVRGTDGTLRAFHNVCPHRGHPICSGSGSNRHLRCPYHQWTFATDGALSQRPDAGTFDDDGTGLSEVRCTALGGLVWVCLDGGAPALRQWLGPVADRFGAYRVDRMSIERDTTMPLACNWKASVDVHNESYHVRLLHPAAVSIVDVDGVEITDWAPHARMRVPFHEGAPHAPGPNNDMFYVFPNLQLNCYRDQLLLFRHRPDPRDPARCLFDQQIFHRADAPRRGRAHQALTRGVDSLGPVTDADLDVVEQLQRGMASSGFESPRLSSQESLIASMHRTLDAFVTGAA